MSDTSMALFLAQKMGLDVLAHEGKCYDENSCEWSPAINKAQLMDCILWAAKNMRNTLITRQEVCCTDDECALVEHDQSEADIMRATVEAIAKAAGWEPQE